MNICLISREYPTEDHTGGIATYTEKTARTLASWGHTVHVVTESGRDWATRIEDGVTVISVPALPSRVPLIDRSRAVARVLARLPQTADIVQACEYRAEAFWYALKKPAGTRLVTRLATPSSLVEQLNTHETGHGLRAHVVDRLERLQTQRSDGIISPTKALADLVCERWRIAPERVTVIRTGVDFARRYGSEAADLPAELRGREYLIYFGRLEERKGVHVLAQALPRVLAAFPQLHMVFAGSVQQYQGRSLRAYIKERNEGYQNRLHFYPRLAHEQLYPLLEGALAAVLPSLWENLANTCLEALDMGKPVVATTGCGFSEAIEDGRSGMLVPPANVPALENALLVLLSDRGKLQSMSQEAKARAEHFKLDVVTRGLLDFYEMLRARGTTHRPSHLPLASTTP